MLTNSLITSCLPPEEDALLFPGDYHALPKPEEINALPLAERFDAIATIRDIITRRTSQKATPQELDFLLKVLSPMKFGPDLEEFLITITEEAIVNLTTSALDVEKWINLRNESNETRRDLYQRLHNAIIHQAKTRTAENPKLSEKFVPTQVHVLSNSSKPSGWVGARSNSEERDIFVNQTNQILAMGEEESVDIVIHETVHILLDHFSKALKDSPECIPEKIRSEIEAANFHRLFGATIPHEVNDAVYRAQLEERITFAVAEHGARFFKQRLSNFTP